MEIILSYLTNSGSWKSLKKHQNQKLKDFTHFLNSGYILKNSAGYCSKRAPIELFVLFCFVFLQKSYQSLVPER